MAFLAEPHLPKMLHSELLRSLLEGPQALGREAGVGVAWLTHSPQETSQ